MNTTINILTRRKQSGEQLADHEDYALLIGNQLSAIINGTERSDYNEGEDMTFDEYLDDVLDVEYRSGGDGEYRSVKVAVALGGPACYLDTDLQAVICAWWSDTCVCEYGKMFDERAAITEAIDGIFSDLYMLSAA